MCDIHNEHSIKIIIKDVESHQEDSAVSHVVYLVCTLTLISKHSLIIIITIIFMLTIMSSNTLIIKQTSHKIRHLSSIEWCKQVWWKTIIHKDLSFELLVERISVSASYLYCTICELVVSCDGSRVERETWVKERDTGRENCCHQPTLLQGILDYWWILWILYSSSLDAIIWLFL